MAQTINNAGNNTVGASNTGQTNTLTVTNSSNTASSAALINVNVGGSSADDAFTTYTVTGVTNWSQGIDNSASDAYVLAASTALGTTNVISASTAGEINYPLQPAFLAYVNTSILNVTGDGTIYTIIYDTEVYDQNADFNLGTSTFTAPVTGRYFFQISILLLGGTAISSAPFRIVSSNRTYQLNLAVSGTVSSTAFQGGYSVIADMDVNDTVTITIQSSDTGGKIDDVSGTTSGDLRTFISGYLVA